MDHCGYYPDDKIDRFIPVAPYRQLACILRARIARGDWPPGGRIPGEAQLVGEYGLARSTIRRTIKKLTDDGIVFVVPRDGTYVTEHLWPPPQRTPPGHEEQLARLERHVEDLARHVAALSEHLTKAISLVEEVIHSLVEEVIQSRANAQSRQ